MRISFRTLLAAAGAVALGTNSVAQADVLVRAYVDKFKEKNVVEDINITKTILLTVIEDILVDSAAEQEIVKNQRNQFNYVEEDDSTSSATIGDADTTVGNGANGILLFNQAPGFANNQGNEVSVTFAESPTFDATADGEKGVLVHTQVAVEQINGWNPPELEWEWEPESLGCPGDPDCFLVKRPVATEPPPGPVNEYVNVLPNTNIDTIVGAFGDASGIVGINQSAGSMNNQDNAVALALGDFAVFALGEIDLGQTNTYNRVEVIELTRTDIITDSFNGFDGIVTVNQSAGAMNNQANLIDIAVSGSKISVNLNPGDGGL
jgi:hypothetical protein